MSHYKTNISNLPQATAFQAITMKVGQSEDYESGMLENMQNRISELTTIVGMLAGNLHKQGLLDDELMKWLAPYGWKYIPDEKGEN